MKLCEWLDIWLNKYIKHIIKIKTYITYEDICKKHIIPLLGHYKLKELSSLIIQDFIIYKIEKGNLINHKALSYNTVNMIISVLKQSLNKAYELELIDKNLTKNITLPQSKEKKIEVFNLKEQQIIESFCLTHKKK